MHLARQRSAMTLGLGVKYFASSTKMNTRQLTKIYSSELMVFKDMAVTFHKCYDKQRNDSVHNDVDVAP